MLTSSASPEVRYGLFLAAWQKEKAGGGDQNIDRNAETDRIEAVVAGGAHLNMVEPLSRLPLLAGSLRHKGLATKNRSDHLASGKRNPFASQSTWWQSGFCAMAFYVRPKGAVPFLVPKIRTVPKLFYSMLFKFFKARTFTFTDAGLAA